ncbi:pstB domain protein [Mycobacterium xenopi 4042]|uniref:PstB domain protein n=1 Tax=Mycobacterium xenopi 4042 TaxID=1299334 RepID=X7ZDY7_MYCXE|nr:pstB domain protein [Mycobacterium xenopi 4042]
MVGLLINTVPVRARITGKPRSPSCSSSCSTCTTTHSNISTWRLATFTAPRPRATVRHPFRVRELSNRHRRLSGADGLASPSSPPANTTTTAVRGGRARRELVLRVEFDTEVFDAPGVEALTERLRRVLVAMTADPGGGCRWWMCWTKLSASGLMVG